MSSISSSSKEKIYRLIDNVVNKYIEKAENNPNADSGNPFALALFKDFDCLTHTIHGAKTSLGTEMEKIAEILATDVWGESSVRRKLNIIVSLPDNVFNTIDGILNNLSSTSNKPSYYKEKELIIKACDNPSSKIAQHVYEFDMELYDKNEDYLYYLEMKGPDPNTTEVPGAKKRLLVSLAYSYLYCRHKNNDSIFAIYYNNKHPKEYNNPKVMCYFDNSGGLLVHDKFWNFIGKSDTTFIELVQIFDEYREKNKEKIWTGFSGLMNKI